MFQKVLLANRGEIACRIARTCRRLGVSAAGVHSTADRDSLHVRQIGQSLEIGGPPAAESYLRIERVIEAAKSVGAEAIHPGFGFLAETRGVRPRRRRRRSGLHRPDAGGHRPPWRQGPGQARGHRRRRAGGAGQRRRQR